MERECTECQQELITQMNRFATERDEFTHSYEEERITLYQATIDDYVNRRISVLRKQLETSHQSTLFIKHYLPLDSVIETVSTPDTFDIEALNVYGAAGWRLVSFVPKTVGLGLRNEANNALSTQSWGGGIGGNVIGVYAIMELVVSSETIPSARIGLSQAALQIFPPPAYTTEYVSLHLTAAPGTKKKDLLPLAALSGVPLDMVVLVFSVPKCLASRIRKSQAIFIQDRLLTHGFNTIIGPEKESDGTVTELFQFKI
jgi:hypothetical protein